MRITVIVKPNTSTNSVIEKDEGVFQVLTTATPEKGKANSAVIKLLAKHFSVPQVNVQLVFGRTAREKIFEITTKD